MVESAIIEMMHHYRCVCNSPSVNIQRLIPSYTAMEMIWVCLKPKYPADGNWNRENNDSPLESGVAYFQSHTVGYWIGI